MQKTPFQRAYFLLRPVLGGATGTVRIESSRSRGALYIHARHLPEKPVRALLLASDAETGAVLDLGLMRPTGNHQAVLSRENIALQGSRALVLVTDWPEAQLLLCGWLQHQPECALWQVQEAVRRYLAVPAADSAPAPLACPPIACKRSVLTLGSRVPLDKFR